MAVDEAILKSIHNNESLPTLRLYAWSPPCLSLGYAQPYSDINQEALEKLGWDIVRRPTGGRAILHTDELTYSVIGPTNEPRLAGGILESYLNLSQALLMAVKTLGVPAQANEKPKSEPTTSKKQNPVCFEAPSNYEITVHGKKLIGSAQARKKEGVLQHGTLPLCGDLTRILQGLNLDESSIRRHPHATAANQLLERATTMETILGYPISWKEAVEAFIQGFQTMLNITFVDSKLTPNENSWVLRLVKEKYYHPSWTARI